MKPGVAYSFLCSPTESHSSSSTEAALNVVQSAHPVHWFHKGMLIGWRGPFCLISTCLHIYLIVIVSDSWRTVGLSRTRA